MSAAAEWLSGRAASYHRDAGRLARLRETTDELTDLQWSVVYRAVAAELYKCATAVDSFSELPSFAHAYAGLGGCSCGWWAEPEVDDRAYQQAHRLHVVSQQESWGDIGPGSTPEPERP